MSEPGRPGGPDAPHRDLDAPEAAHDHYRSVDSAPAEYAVNRPPRVVNAFLVWFVAVSLLVMLAMTVLVEHGDVVDSRDIVFFVASGDRAAIPVRLFMLVFFAVFALSLATNAWRRAAVLAELCGGLLLVSVLVDVVTLAADSLLGASVAVASQQILAAVVGLALFPAVVLRHAHLPDPVGPPVRRGIRPHAWLRLLVPVVVATTLAHVVATRFEPVVSWMRGLALLGGVGPGVFLVQQLFVLLSAGVGVVLVTRSRRARFAPPLAVLVPAHNEAHGIAATIDAVDRASSAYAGPVHLYVVDNVSSDGTATVARRAIDRSRYLRTTLLSCPTPGKAQALNHGLARIGEPFVVRIDADVVVSEHCLRTAMRHFAHPDVAAVGGLPLPANHRTFIGRVRLVEVLLRHGVYQEARMGYDGVAGVPGMFSALRRAALDRAGDIRPGINGEDTDICMRLNSLGYRCLVDPLVSYTTETPRTWSHLREQRTRWFRSIYHVAAHNRRALLRGGSMAGAVVLPFALMNSARRAMLTPVLLFGLLVLGVFPQTFTGLRWQPVLAMVVGIPALVAVVVSLLLGRPRAILYVPEYLVFRLVRSYFTLGAILSLRFEPVPPPWRRRRGSRGVSPEAGREARTSVRADVPGAADMAAEGTLP